jgi:hypothetical protein
MESLPKKLIKGWASMLKWIKEKIRARKFITGPPDEELCTYKPGEVIFRAIGIKNIGNETIYFPSVRFVALPIAPDHTVRPPVDYLFAGWAKEPVNIPPEPYTHFSKN